ncbi:hypothetical protein MKK65_12215 [Methylobacterium sp. J-001]|uniref:hypothetical protein n=1 Tax=Methylobacterium sp. J-001 TaxID=2836609 RepID=UPI001FB96C88|nr:hypothetical protein [Methylobacterium sp. J-001]MCJ2117314.1 hypothetical protein [Methylobacterium sp. J-001]
MAQVKGLGGEAPKRHVAIEDDIAAVRAALREAEACTDPDDIDGMTLVRALRDSLDGLLAEQRRAAEAKARRPA